MYRGPWFAPQKRTRHWAFSYCNNRINLFLLIFNALDMHHEEEVIILISNLYDIPKENISVDCHLKSHLGLDSLDVIEIAMECESKYNISVPDAEYENINYVKDIIRIVDEYSLLLQKDKNGFRL
jgi:acyl carrier protein